MSVCYFVPQELAAIAFVKATERECKAGNKTSRTEYNNGH